MKTVEDKMRRIAHYLGSATLEYRDCRFFAGPYEVPISASGLSPDAALDELVLKVIQIKKLT